MNKLLLNTRLFLYNEVHYALFTSVPTTEVLGLVKDRLEKDSSLLERTRMSPIDISDCLKLVLDTTYLTFKGKIYKQTFGTPMGSPVSPLVANIFMEDLEQRAIDTATHAPFMWHRYCDDVLAAMKPDEVQPFLQHLNNMSPSIKFTVETEVEGKLPFLDMTLKRSDDGHIKTDVYYKPTASGQYLNYQSHHPEHQKHTVIHTLTQRALAICEETDDCQTELKNIDNMLQQNKYPASVINSEMRKVKTKFASNPPSHQVQQQAQTTDATTRSESGTTNGNKRKVMVLPYIEGISQALKRVNNTFDIKTYFKPQFTVRQMLVHPKDPVPKDEKPGVVYKMKCGDCSKVYVGESGRNLKERQKEHMRHLTHPSTTDILEATAEHSLDTGHSIDWQNTETLTFDTRTTQRRIKEAIHIQLQTSPTLNRNVGKYTIFSGWLDILKRQKH